jgi:hypothetical protein
MGWQDAPIKNAWEQAPTITPGIDPQTNAPYDPSIPTNMTLQQGRNAQPYKPTTMEKIGNAWDASALFTTDCPFLNASDEFAPVLTTV